MRNSVSHARISCARGFSYKCVGTWKVYGDADAAQRIFERYQTCTNNYCRRMEEGESLQSLAVAV